MSTQPLDLVKTRLMTQGLRPSGLQMYRGVLHTIRTVVREEGLRGLSRGLGTRLVFTASFNAIGFPVFEAAKGRLVRRAGASRSRAAVRRCLLALGGEAPVSCCATAGRPCFRADWPAGVFCPVVRAGR